MKTIEVIDPATIASERKRLGLTQADLAGSAALKGGRSHLHKIESGTVSPGLATLQSITLALRREDLQRHAARARGDHTVRRRGDTTRRTEWT